MKRMGKISISAAFGVLASLCTPFIYMFLIFHSVAVVLPYLSSLGGFDQTLYVTYQILIINISSLFLFSISGWLLTFIEIDITDYFLPYFIVYILGISFSSLDNSSSGIYYSLNIVSEIICYSLLFLTCKFAIMITKKKCTQQVV